MPPASSLTAESPVPAPPPMIGSPRAICWRNRFRMPFRELSKGCLLSTTNYQLPNPNYQLPNSRLLWELGVGSWELTQFYSDSHQFQQLRRRRVGEVRIVDM